MFRDLDFLKCGCLGLREFHQVWSECHCAHKLISTEHPRNKITKDLHYAMLARLTAAAAAAQTGFPLCFVFPQKLIEFFWLSACRARFFFVCCAIIRLVMNFNLKMHIIQLCFFFGFWGLSNRLGLYFALHYDGRLHFVTRKKCFRCNRCCCYFNYSRRRKKAEICILRDFRFAFDTVRCQGPHCSALLSFAWPWKLIFYAIRLCTFGAWISIIHFFSHSPEKGAKVWESSARQKRFCREQLCFNLLRFEGCTLPLTACNCRHFSSMR